MTAKDVARRGLRAAFHKLPESTMEDLRRKRAEFSGIGQLKVNQALLAKRLADLEQERGMGPTPTAEVEDDRFPPHVRSKLCTSAQLNEPWFEKWCAAIGEPPVAHRKHWEFAYIAEVLDSLGQLEPGRRGVGFGVGREAIIAAFANRGVEILATDLAPDAAAAEGWIKSDQHAVDGVEGLQHPDVCEPDVFRKLVSWRAVDMADIPDDIRGYDFTWSACSLEHIGTLELGTTFIEKSLDTLVPGGIAVHTTEFNLTSNDDTVEAGPTVVYRERDMIALRDRLEAQGHEVAALDFSQGDGLLDRYVDVPPYADEPVLRFLFAPYTLTSIAIVVRKGGGAA